VVGTDLLADGTPTLTITWMVCPVLAVAVIRGPRWGVLAAIGMGACDLAVRGVINQATVTGSVIMVMAAAALGYLAEIATRAGALRVRPGRGRTPSATARARHHDSVLQVPGAAARGTRGEATGRLAGEQVVALRALVASEGRPPASGLVDVRAALAGLAGSDVSLASPATAVWLPAHQAGELGAAVGAAVENVRRHCPAGTHAWILLEEGRARLNRATTARHPGRRLGAGRQAASG
jgi:hypothetical protein